MKFLSAHLCVILIFNLELAYMFRRYRKSYILKNDMEVTINNFFPENLNFPSRKSIYKFCLWLKLNINFMKVFSIETKIYLLNIYKVFLMLQNEDKLKT